MGGRTRWHRGAGGCRRGRIHRPDGVESGSGRGRACGSQTVVGGGRRPVRRADRRAGRRFGGVRERRTKSRMVDAAHRRRTAPPSTRTRFGVRRHPSSLRRTSALDEGHRPGIPTLASRVGGRHTRSHLGMPQPRRRCRRMGVRRSDGAARPILASPRALAVTRRTSVRRGGGWALGLRARDHHHHQVASHRAPRATAGGDRGAAGRRSHRQAPGCPSRRLGVSLLFEPTQRRHRARR